MDALEAMRQAREALREAGDAIESWGAYASEYFQDKHDLQADVEAAKSAIAALDAAIAAAEQVQPITVSDERLRELLPKLGPEWTDYWRKHIEDQMLTYARAVIEEERK